MVDKGTAPAELRNQYQKQEEAGSNAVLGDKRVLFQERLPGSRIQLQRLIALSWHNTCSC